VIDTDAKLGAFLTRIQSVDWVAMDTEADSLHAYPEKLCLIQLSTASGDDLVDPLASVSLEPLLEALAGHELIMHGADYDLRLLRRHHEFVPRSIFDTMLAARLLGLRQFSLSHLVEHHLGVKLEKGAQKANWALRPLTERMAKYARNDTRFLKPLADRLRAELVACGRLSWHQESCARLIADAAKQRPDNLDGIWRVKGSHLLGRPALAILRELWHWREAEAINANRPPFFVLSHENLAHVAAAGAGARPIEPFLPKHFSQRRREGVAQAISRGLGIAPENQPKPLRSKGRRVSEGERRRHQELQRRRDARATELGIDPTLIASRATLASLAYDWDRAQGELMAWQRQLLEA
jgi:ribonuclease D